MMHARFDFGTGFEPCDPFRVFDRVILDRGSCYAASIGQVFSRAEIAEFLRRLKSHKRYANATHHSWAVRVQHAGAVYETTQDDGERGAGAVILRAMQSCDVINGIVCVTRWYGGVKLHGDRFRHVRDAAYIAIESVSMQERPTNRSE
jgi:putative IMPACT (imprinted ancient) family translation regulator